MIDKELALKIRDKIVKACPDIYGELSDEEKWMLAVLNAETYFKAKNTVNSSQDDAIDTIVNLYRLGCSHVFISYCLGWDELEVRKLMSMYYKGLPNDDKDFNFYDVPLPGLSKLDRLNGLSDIERNGVAKALEAGYNYIDIANMMYYPLHDLIKDVTDNSAAVDLLHRWQSGFSVQYLSALYKQKKTTICTWLHELNCDILSVEVPDFNVDTVNSTDDKYVIRGKYTFGASSRKQQKLILTRQRNREETDVILRELRNDGYELTVDKVSMLLCAPKGISEKLLKELT